MITWFNMSDISGEGGAGISGFSFGEGGTGISGFSFGAAGLWYVCSWLAIPGALRDGRADAGVPEIATRWITLKKLSIGSQRKPAAYLLNSSVVCPLLI